MKAIKQSSIYTQNIGSGDRVIRYVVGAALIGLFMAYQETGNRYEELIASLALVSIVVISTAIVRWDPIYAMLGIHTVASARKRLRNSAVNVGMTDSAVRLAVGSAMIGGFMLFSPTPVGWTVLLPLLAIPVIVTSIIGWCPTYSVAKVNTSRVYKVKKVALPRFIGPKLPRTGHPNAV
jgi:hypothetical protein